MRRSSAIALALLFGAGAAAPAFAEKAPSVEPSKWFNGKGEVSWDGLKGRLILVEKWATW
jgi:hypothetical protein